MFIRRRVKHFQLIPDGVNPLDKAKLTLLALFYLLPNSFTNKQAHTPDAIIKLTRGVKLRTKNTYYQLSHPRQLFMISDGYERHIRHWFNQSGNTFLDIGANIGKYTIMLAPSFKEVHAFEPIGETYATLKINVEENQLTNVSVHNIAVWNRQELLTFYLKNNPGGNSAEMIENNIGATKVRAFPLDQMGESFGVVDFVKLDVEGAELQALEGMRRLLKKHKPVMVIEILERNEAAVYRFMKGLQYELVDKQNRNHLWKPQKTL